ncbi:MAG: YvcK family protein [Bacilli bacterium]|nr:YvcK family protein [Bacilli bacterium]
MNKKVVVFGGGTGISFLLRGLKSFPVDITAIISVADNGSSTGKLREEFLMPAMGDIRNVIVNMSDANDKIKELLQYRFDTYTDLDGHPIGNLILVGMYNITGSLKESIKVLSDFLNVRHKILPLSEDYLTLMGETENGDIIRGETEIGHDPRKLKRLFYDEEPIIDKEVLKEIASADLIIFSMGSLFTSIIPHLLSKDIVKAIDKSSAKILYTCNAVCQIGETEDYTATDHVDTINKYLGKRKVDAVIVANSKIPKRILNNYISSENKDLVKYDKQSLKSIGCEVLAGDILTIEDNYIRHDNMRLATTIFNYLMR